MKNVVGNHIMFAFEDIVCGECGGEVELFMLETYEMFHTEEDGVEEYLCSSCLHEVSGD